MTVFAKSGSSSDLGGYVGGEFYDATTDKVTVQSANVISTNWKSYTFTFVAPSTFTYFKVYSWKNAGSSYL